MELMRRIVRAGFGAVIAAGAAGWNTASAQVDTVWVDVANPNCAEGAAGTASAPFCSIMDAITARHAPGTLILVRPGSYLEQITVPASGFPDQLITVRAMGEPGNPVVIDGADDFGHAGLWAPAGGLVWRAGSVTWIPQQVRAHGVRIKPWTGPVAELPLDSWAYVPGAGLYVNVGGDPSTQDVRVGRRRYGVYLPNRSYIRVEGFTIIRSDDRGIQLNIGSHHNEIVGNVVRWSANIGIQAAGTTDTRIASNLVTENNDHGISLMSGSTRCTLEDNESSHNADPARRRANGVYLFGCPENVLIGNRWHHNQDSGEQIQSGSNDVISIQNLSWANGDHGFDHLRATGSVIVGNVAYGNYKDGFSFEGSATGGSVYNAIAIENGLTTNEADLWVDESSMPGFTSNDNIFWNSSALPPIKRGGSGFASVSAWMEMTGLDTRSAQQDPLFADPDGGDFHLKPGSPAIDNANSNVPHWPLTDASGLPRANDPQTADAGMGPVTFADRGAFEFQPPITSASVPRTRHEPRRDPDIQIQPNPMDAAAELRFDTRRTGALDVAVYDLGGRRVRTVRAAGTAAAGAQRFTLDARADDGRPLEAGIYFVRVQGPDGPISTRLLVRR